MFDDQIEFIIIEKNIKRKIEQLSKSSQTRRMQSATSTTDESVIQQLSKKSRSNDSLRSQETLISQRSQRAVFAQFSRELLSTQKIERLVDANETFEQEKL